MSLRPSESPRRTADQLCSIHERLQLMHDMFHMGDNDRFYFEWDWLVGRGLSVKDFIAPTSFSFPGGRTFTMGSLCGAMSYLQITASDLSDQLLKDFLDVESSKIVTMHIQSVDQTAAKVSIDKPKAKTKTKTKKGPEL